MTRPFLSSKRDSIPADIGGARRKRIGQYFTGQKLAQLLVALAADKSFGSALDPMCGSGDMLSAVDRILPNTSLAGIEIDDEAFNCCSSRLGSRSTPVSLILGNAFSWSTISSLPRSSFDLVITNPPYVRYQSFADSAGLENPDQPRATDVRSGLLEIARKVEHLNKDDRGIFISAISGYSGLSDLAVPAWILCMMLTAPGGRLAMVVPESWLSRNYADPIHYLLLKLFRIHYVVEDEDRVWFDGIQVKTTLLVAERLSGMNDLLSTGAQHWYVHVGLQASAMNNESVVGHLYQDALNPDRAFAEELESLRDGSGITSSDDYSVTRPNLAGKVADLMASASKSAWLRACEPELTISHLTGCGSRSTPKIPQALMDLFSGGGTLALTTLEALGVHVGQGLRTGSNDFFYCDLVECSKDECLVSSSKALGSGKIAVPENATRPVLRKQSEAPTGYVLDAAVLSGRVLTLGGHIRASDVAPGHSEMDRRILMTPELAAFITEVERLNVGTEEHPKHIPQLSAVRTNSSKGKRGAFPRFWYMLPPLTKRHLPDLFVPRINYSHPKTFLNSEDRTVIDANFSTLWLGADARVTRYALLACLNSLWVTTAMELSASVLGGGALKLEATHIRRLPIPELSEREWTRLSDLGKRLTDGDTAERALAEVDSLITQSLFGTEADLARRRLDTIRREKLRARMKK